VTLLGDREVTGVGTVGGSGAPADSAVERRRLAVRDAIGNAPDGEHRPHLDGLRTLAVYLVLLFHAGSERFAGGFIGVDVFFVLSGYLVTGVLLRDLGGHGRVRLWRFYARRMRRLMPAAVLTILVTGAVFGDLLGPADAADLASASRWSLLYGANWFFAVDATDYFGSASPLLHFWSLAVEEQFYVIWPLLLSGLFALVGRRRAHARDAVGAVVLGLAVASAAIALLISTSSPNWAYYGTHARMYQLALGALLVLHPSVAARLRPVGGALAAAALGAIVLVGSSLLDVSPIVRGLLAATTTAIAIASLESGANGATKALLSRPAFVYLGRISYSTYLWHLPVIMVIRDRFDVSTGALVALSALVATGIASLSHQLLEMPIRGSRWLDRFPRAVVATGLAVCVASAVVVVPRVTGTAAGSTSAEPSAFGFTPVPPGIVGEARAGARHKFTYCTDRPVAECTIVSGTGKHLLLLGDSHANMMIEAFAKMARDENLTLSVSVRGGCPWPRDLYARPIGLFDQELRIDKCKAFKNDTYDRIVPQLDPDVIVVMQSPHEDPELVPFVGPEGKVLSEEATKTWVRTTTSRSMQALIDGRRELVIIEPIPHAAGQLNPLNCLAQADFIEECRYVVSPIPTWLEEYYRQVDRRSANVKVANFDRLLCPFWPICDPILNGEVVRWDASHITDQFSASIGDDVAAWFKENGVIPA
jgi:peptidoglycan/LPS O-acetylase OafA/YrhL